MSVSIIRAILKSSSKNSLATFAGKLISSINKECIGTNDKSEGKRKAEIVARLLL